MFSTKDSVLHLQDGVEILNKIMNRK